MAMETGNNFYNAVQGVMGLFSNVNKAKKGLDEDDGDLLIVPEFKSTMNDDDIRKLTAQWTSDYDSYFTKEIKQKQKDNVNYWIGRQYNEFQTAGTKRPLVDNLLFEALETFLPIATRANPEANVFADGTPEGDKLARTVQKALEYQAGRQNLRMKLKGTTRNWGLYLIGAVKIVWDSTENDMDTKVVLPTSLIFDPNAEIGVDGKYYGEFLGEKKKATARRLSKMFPNSASRIKEACQGNMGTRLQYVEWCTRTDVFYMLGDEVLGKFKNPHWNYSGKTMVRDPETNGETEVEVEGQNHFAQPEIPYLFLSIFNLGRQPHDETSLMTQNIPLQDTVNKRYQQIDSNVDSQNNGIVLSGKYFTKEQAAEAATQLKRGNPLWVPEGDIRESYARDTAPALPSDVFQHLDDARNELRNIFGTSGSTPQGTESQKSVRGKILINQLDSSRIGGGVTEYIEKVACSLYNWYIQMMYVYYTEEHAFAVVGAKAQELMSIKNTDFHTKLVVTVKDGSLIPKDPLTKRNEAMDLWSANAIAPIPLFTMLDYPNPYESAKELVTWQLIQKGVLPPTVMFPDLEQPQQIGGVGQNTSPAVSNAEDNRNVSSNPQDAAGITSKQLLSSVKI